MVRAIAVSNPGAELMGPRIHGFSPGYHTSLVPRPHVDDRGRSVRVIRESPASSAPMAAPAASKNLRSTGCLAHPGPAPFADLKSLLRRVPQR